MIINFKPKLRQKLAAQKEQSQANLDTLPRCYGSDLEKIEVFLHMLQTFSFTLNDVVKNSRLSIDKSQEENPDWLLRGRVRELFDEHSTDFSNLKMKFFEADF